MHLVIVLPIVIEDVFVSFWVSAKFPDTYIAHPCRLILFHRDQVVRGLVEGPFLSVEDEHSATLIFLQV